MKEKNGTMNGELRQELLAELKSLRVAVRDAGEGFVLRKEGEIEALSGYLLALPAGKLRTVAKEWHRELRDLNIKPAKGRLRDLKRIDHLLGGLLNVIIEADTTVAGLRPATPPHQNAAATGVDPSDEQLP